MRHAIFLIITGLVLGGALRTAAQPESLRLWYEQPAHHWEECVPLGNGRLGAMPDGGILKENIILNDITLWSGGVQDADSPEAGKYLPRIQQLLLEGKNDEAEALMYKSFVCKGPGSGEGNGADVAYGSYEVLGALHIEYGYSGENQLVKPSSYVRELLLDKAIAKTTFTIDGTTYTREYFTSFHSDVIMIRLTSDKPKMIDISISLDRPENFVTMAKGAELEMTGQLNNGTDGKGMQYITRVKVKPEGGKQRVVNGKLKVEHADAVTVYVAAATNFHNPDFKNKLAADLSAAVNKKYVEERDAHQQKYQTLFNRTQLDLGSDAKKSLPTDKRLQVFATDPGDPGLAALYFQYGRYLLISSTRPGLLPPNLQGLWANTIRTPWNGDYHLNINIQMNHWPLNVVNLPMLNEPFYQLVSGLVAPGQKTARVYYNSEGWVAHVITNVWGYTSPGEHPSWGSFNTGSAWLCQMLWTHYVFTKDRSYLEKIYDILKGSARFYLNTLVKDPATGWLVTSPSNSPENAFRLPNGKVAHVCMGPTIDNQILRALFGYVKEAGEVLNKDEVLRKELDEALKKLPPGQISKDGRLMEWLQDYEEVEPAHRHISHLWGLYPGNEITPQKTPDLANAAAASLEKRGDGGTGWSLAWKINLWARLRDGERAYKIFQRFLRPVQMQGVDMKNGGGTYANLFCAHPPFQIDGNFGTTAGIAEMLVQSHNGYIEFLPALPDAWATGKFSGLCVSGAIVDAQWKNKKLTNVRITAVASDLFEISVPAASTKTEVKRDGRVSDAGAADRVKLDLKKGEQAEITFYD